MIKIQFTGNSPNMYQIERNYNLPGVTGAVQWNGDSKCLEVSTGTNWQRIDNTVELNCTNNMAPDVWAMWSWIEEKKKQELELAALRNKYPALDEAYNHLELIKALVTAGPEKNDIQQN